MRKGAKAAGTGALLLAEDSIPVKLPQEFDEHISSYDAAVVFGRTKVSDRCDFLRDQPASLFHKRECEHRAGK